MRTTLWRVATTLAVAAPLALFAQSALADTVSVNFENPPYTIGVINGQDGWSATGSAGSGCAVYDEGVSGSLGTTGFGSQSFRLSDAVTSGCFGDQAFAKPLTNSVGETAATAGAFSVGTKQPHFEMQFDIASTQTTQQVGMHMSVSPDRGDGSRMSYLRFDDMSDGIHVFFDDVQQPGACVPAGCANFVETAIGTISRSPHTIKLTMDTIDGPGNDVVKVYIDGTLVHTGTSWEDYYRYDPEANAEQSPRIVKTVEFRESGTATPADSGKGYLIDNLSLMSGPTPVDTPPAMCPAGTTQAASPIETVVVNSNSTSPAMTVGNLANGMSYILKASGTWQNSLNLADAEYTTTDNWSTHMDGYDINPYFLGASEFDLEVNNAFVNWGNYSSGHTYTYLYSGTGAPASFLVFDGDSNGGPSNINSGWYGDNSGTLSVDVYPCNPAVHPKVVIAKYVDGVHATAANANNSAFPMVTSWVSSGVNGTQNNVPFTLSPSPWGGVGDPYEATYINGEAGDNYATNEVTTGNDVVGSSCSDGKPFALQGYSTGDSFAAAQAAAVTPTAPSFTNLQSDKYVIVWNVTCPQYVQVHITKYVDGAHATAANANSATFQMQATYSGTSQELGVINGTNPYDLNVAGNYEATTLHFVKGFHYGTSENMNNVVGATCGAGKPFTLQGYKVGATLSGAQGAATTTTAPDFANLQSDEYVLVFNQTCPTTPPPPPANACATPGVAPAGFTLVTSNKKNETVVLVPQEMYVNTNGNITVSAGNGNYIICTGSGNDTINIGNGTSVIDAGNGNNTIKTGDGDQHVTTGTGNDAITTGAGNDTINAGNGNNSINSGGGNDSNTTGTGNDVINGGNGTDTCNAGTGMNSKTSCEL